MTVIIRARLGYTIVVFAKEDFTESIITTADEQYRHYKSSFKIKEGEYIAKHGFYSISVSVNSLVK